MSLHTLANWMATFTCRVWQEEVTGVNHSNLPYVRVNVKSEVFKAGHAAAINITEDTNAPRIPGTHQHRHFIRHSSVLFAPLSMSEGEKREWEKERGRFTHLQSNRVTSTYAWAWVVEGARPSLVNFNKTLPQSMPQAVKLLHQTLSSSTPTVYHQIFLLNTHIHTQTHTLIIYTPFHPSYSYLQNVVQE